MSEKVGPSMHESEFRAESIMLRLNSGLNLKKLEWLLSDWNFLKIKMAP